MINFFQRQEKIPQTIPAYASICAKFSSHSLILLASMFPICLRISRGEQINPFALLQCCSSSSPPELCTKTVLLAAEDTESPSSCTDSHWAPLPSCPLRLHRHSETLMALTSRHHQLRDTPQIWSSVLVQPRAFSYSRAAASPQSPLILIYGPAANLDLGLVTLDLPPRLRGCA